MQFQAFWQKHCESIEAAFAAQGGQIDFLQSIVTGLQEAQRAASEASQGVETLNSGISLTNSSTDPVDGLLTASSAGTITIAAHDRVYTSGSTETRVSVNGGSIGGFSSGQFVRVFYNDAARAGGAVAYQGTTEEKTQVGDTHVIGGVIIPQAGSPPSEGQGTTPPGYVRPSSFENPLQ
jgi:hypothetical protein